MGHWGLQLLPDSPGMRNLVPLGFEMIGSAFCVCLGGGVLGVRYAEEPQKAGGGARLR